MPDSKNSKRYDLEGRTFDFAHNVRVFVRSLPKNQSNYEDAKQVVRSSGSIGANYIEANEALSKKDFLMRVKICRKESKETSFWLRLLFIGDNNELSVRRSELAQEAEELLKIFNAIIVKSERK